MTSAPLSAAQTVAAPTRPDYWDEAVRALVRRDRILKRLVPRYHDAALLSRGDPFTTLARSIIGQQISVKAAQSIWLRFAEAFKPLKPAIVTRGGIDAMRACGLSQRKAEYLLDLAASFQEKRVHPHTWQQMDDEAVISELTAIRGIGRWTAEMFLIFNLNRPDVLPLDDLGLIKAISMHYFSGEPVSRFEAREVAQAWKPWRTVATLYLWRSLDPIPVSY